MRAVKKSLFGGIAVAAVFFFLVISADILGLHRLSGLKDIALPDVAIFWIAAVGIYLTEVLKRHA